MADLDVKVSRVILCFLMLSLTHLWKVLFTTLSASFSFLRRNFKAFIWNSFTQIDWVSPKSHPGDPENALFCSQEKLPGTWDTILQLFLTGWFFSVHIWGIQLTWHWFIIKGLYRRYSYYLASDLTSKHTLCSRGWGVPKIMFATGERTLVPTGG